MVIDDGIISKAQLSRLLDISKARVSQLVTLGLPVRDDGKIDRATALSWIKRNTWHGNDPSRGALVGAQRALGEKQASPRFPLHLAFAENIESGADRRLAIAGVTLAYRLPAMAAALAIGAGATLEVAYALHAAFSVATVNAVADLLAEMQCPPFADDPEAAVWVVDPQFSPDWKGLAAASGQRFDRKACAAHLAQRFGDDAPAPAPAASELSSPRRRRAPRAMR
jgi:hypothetical protein